MLEILQYIESLSSIASLVLQAHVSLRSDSTADIQEALGRIELTDQQKEELSRNGAIEIVAIFVIDRDLLEEIEKMIRKCISHYRITIQKTGNRGSSDIADRQAERCVCDALNRIKRRNDGKLPAGDFQRWWTSYRCVDDFDY